jgi:SsrA-binding protein
LLHQREIERLTGKTKERGLTLIPLKIYFKNGRAKVELGLARGKKLYDKRETLRRKVAQREVERSIKARH